MALIGKRTTFKSKWLRVHDGVSDKSLNDIVQVAVVSPTTKEVKAINLGAARRAEIASDLDAAAQAIRQHAGLVEATPVPVKKGLFG